MSTLGLVDAWFWTRTELHCTGFAFFGFVGDTKTHWEETKVKNLDTQEDISIENACNLVLALNVFLVLEQLFPPTHYRHQLIIAIWFLYLKYDCGSVSMSMSVIH